MRTTSDIHSDGPCNDGEPKKAESVVDKSPFSLFCDERGYLNQIECILQHGHRKGDRTGTGVVSVFGSQARYSLRGKYCSFSLVEDVLFCCHTNRTSSPVTSFPRCCQTPQSKLVKLV